MKLFSRIVPVDRKKVEEEGLIIDHHEQINITPVGKGIGFVRQVGDRGVFVKIDLTDDIEICKVNYDDALLPSFEDFADEELDAIQYGMRNVSRVFELKEYLREYTNNEAIIQNVNELSENMKGTPNKASEIGKKIKIQLEDVEDYVNREYRKKATEVANKFLRKGCKVVDYYGDIVILDQTILNDLHQQGKIKII